MSNPNVDKHVHDNDSTRSLIEWSEFHYHLLSFLIDENTPRELAMGIELQIFPKSPMPDVVLLEVYINAFIDTNDALDAVTALTRIYNKNLLPNQKHIAE